MTPTARTLAECRKRGWEVDVVERRVTRFVKRDFLGCIDLIAVTPEGQIIGIQATSGDHHAERVSKCIAEPRIVPWLRAGGFVEVWSWSKTGARNKRKRWTLRIESIGVNENGATATGRNPDEDQP